MAKKKIIPRRTIECRVRVLMAERNVRFVTELVRKLNDVGVTISISQLGRLIDGKAKNWNQEIIEGLITVLDCNVGDIWKVH